MGSGIPAQVQGKSLPCDSSPQSAHCCGFPPFLPSLPLTVSPCPGDAGSLWMLPWKGPQEKPSGRLRRARTRCSPSCTASSSSSAERNPTSARPWHRGQPQPHPDPNPNPNPLPKWCPGGVKTTKVPFRQVLGKNKAGLECPTGRNHSPKAGRAPRAPLGPRVPAPGVRARCRGGAEGALPIPAPKVAAASGLNGFDDLIRLGFNGLDNTLIHYEGCSKMF